VLVLRAVLGWSAVEAADVLGDTTATVNSSSPTPRGSMGVAALLDPPPGGTFRVEPTEAGRQVAGRERAPYFRTAEPLPR
jgi:hypothetical protein